MNKGGVSFLLSPIAKRTYNFWIYVCPEDVEFSVKQAVKTLRTTTERGIVPWGTIILTDDLIIDQLAKFLITEQQTLASEVGKQVLKIVLNNAHYNNKYLEAAGMALNSREKYQE